MGAVIVPPRGEGKATAVLLLHLADDPNDVATSTDGPAGVSFVVTDELYEKYMSVGEAPVVPEPVEDEVERKPVPKRRGRPPKKPVETEE
jgi:hypothetical protein